MSEVQMSACPVVSSPSGYVRPLGGPIEAPKRTSGTDGQRKNKQPNYPKQARTLWKPVEWCVGDGRIALVAFCHCTTVTLWPDLEDARQSRGFIDKSGCGGGCYRDHAIVDLDTGAVL